MYTNKKCMNSILIYRNEKSLIPIGSFKCFKKPIIFITENNIGLCEKCHKNLEKGSSSGGSKILCNLKK